jgi:hypothetical protein
MSLRFDTGPQDGIAMVRSGLQRLANRKSPLNLNTTSFAALSIGSQHAVYDLHADEIANGGGLETAHATGFRYLVTNAGAAVAAAEVHTDATGNSSLLANLNYGPFVGASERAFADLAALNPVRTGEYEARLLRFAAIYVAAVWLKAAAGGADIIYPLAPAPSVLSVGTPYTTEAFLAAIRPLAQQRVGKPDPTKVP